MQHCTKPTMMRLHDQEDLSCVHCGNGKSSSSVFLGRRAYFSCMFIKFEGRKVGLQIALNSNLLMEYFSHCLIATLVLHFAAGKISAICPIYSRIPAVIRPQPLISCSMHHFVNEIFQRWTCNDMVDIHNTCFHMKKKLQNLCQRK